jgi:hypothetical protein
VAIRTKRSVSLPPALAKQIERAAAVEGITFSAWFANAATHRLKIEDGLRAVAEWERENGAFTPAELARAQAIVNGSLGTRRRRRTRRSA